jgi:hypothetical protein
MVPRGLTTSATAAGRRIILYSVNDRPDPTRAIELAYLVGAIERWAADLALAEEPARFVAALESAAPWASGETAPER